MLIQSDSPLQIQLHRDTIPYWENPAKQWNIEDYETKHSAPEQTTIFFKDPSVPPISTNIFNQTTGTNSRTKNPQHRTNSKSRPKPLRYLHKQLRPQIPIHHLPQHCDSTPNSRPKPPLIRIHRKPTIITTRKSAFHRRRYKRHKMNI